MLDVIKSLYKAGMPEGNIFDFTSSRILKFEHKWNTEQRKKAIVDRYKSLGKEVKPKIGESVLEKSAVSERSVSAKTAKSAKSGKSTKKDEKDAKSSKGGKQNTKAKATKSSSPSARKKK